MSKRKNITWAVIGLFLAIQFIRPRRNNDGKVPGAAFVQLYAVPDSLDRILRAACYDCHSNHTSYPWYTNIQPVGWIMAGHVRKGKAKLNFSEFDTYPIRRQISKLKAIANQVNDNEMPLSSYKWLHRNARLSTQEKNWVVSWMKHKADSISNNEQ